MAGAFLKFPATAVHEGVPVWRGRWEDSHTHSFHGVCGKQRSLEGSHDSKADDTGLVEGKSCHANHLGPKLTDGACPQRGVPHVYGQDQGSRNTAPLKILQARIWNKDESCSKKPQEQSTQKPHYLQKLPICGSRIREHALYPAAIRGPYSQL